MQSIGNASLIPQGNITVDVDPHGEYLCSPSSGIAYRPERLLRGPVDGGAGLRLFPRSCPRLARYFVIYAAPRLVAGTRSSLDDEVLKAIRGPIRVLIILIGLYFALKTLDNLSSSIVDVLDTLATVVLILVAAYFVSNLVNACCAGTPGTWLRIPARSSTTI